MKILRKLKSILKLSALKVEKTIEQIYLEGYVQTRLNLLHTLDEIEKSSGGRVNVRVYDQVEGFKEEATIANQLYGIQARNVFSQDRGKFKQHEIFMGVALTSGLDKEVIAFVELGLGFREAILRLF